MPREPGKQFSDLSLELIIYILEKHLPDDGLLTLACVSRQFHHVALKILFHRYNVDLDSESISLQHKDHSIRTLPWLNMPLSTDEKSLVRLSCELIRDFTRAPPESVISEARWLARYASRLSRVEEVDLRVMTCPFEEWEEIILDLLNTLLLKSCTKLSVRTLESNHILFGIPSSQGKTWSSYILGFFARRKSFPSLKTCHIQGLPYYIRPFFQQTLNAAAITEVSFEYIEDSSGWEDFCEQITLPALARLSVTHCAILAKTVLKFLLRHPSIIAFEFHHNTVWTLQLPRLPEGMLPRLAELKMTVDLYYVEYFFPALHTLPTLSWVELGLGSKGYGFEDADAILGGLVPCLADITLCIKFEHLEGIEAWLESGVRLGDQSVMACLSCVKVLKLKLGMPRPRRSVLSDAAVAVLPRWLALFPQLKNISMADRCFRTPPSSSDPLGRLLKRPI